MPQLLLIVDADPGFTDPIRTALEAQGHAVQIHDDAPLELVRKLRPSAMLLSVELPKGGTTGLSICSRLRRDRDLKGMPILLTSSTASADMLRKHSQSSDRADDYARKPIAIDDVVSRLERMLTGAPPRKAETGDLARSPSLTTNDLPRPPSLPTGDMPRVLLTATGDIAPAPLSSASPSEGEFDGEPETQLASSTRDIRPPSLPSRASAAVPPPLKREHIGTATNIEDLWKVTRLDEALRTLASLGPEPQAPAKPSPEERLTYLRQLVKYHETRDKAFREAWEKVQNQGQELARRAMALGLDLNSRDRKLEEVTAERASVERRLQSVEEEFRSFQAEITRIFREKDAEEKQTFAKIQKLEAQNAKLLADFHAAVERNQDHERRLRIFQDEIDGHAAEKEEADRRIAELEARVSEEIATGEELRARLSMTEGVASERADEVEQLQDRLDRLTIETTQERKRLEEATAAKEREHADEIETLEMQHADALAAAEERGTQALETLEKNHGAVVASLETERDIAQSRGDKLADDVLELEQRLEVVISEHTTEVGARDAEIARLKGVEEGLRGELSTLTRERDRLRRDLESRAGDLKETLARVEALESALDDERSGRRAEMAELEANLEEERASYKNTRAELEMILESERLSAQSEKAELEGRLESERAAFQAEKAELEGRLESERATLQAEKAELDEQLETAQRESFDRRVELERKASDLEKEAARAQKLEQALTSRGAELESERGRSKLLEARRVELTHELEGARAQLAETVGTLEATRAQLAERGDELQRAQASLAETEARLQEVERERDDRDGAMALEVGRLEAELETRHARQQESSAALAKKDDLLRHLTSLLRDSMRALDQALAAPGAAPPRDSDADSTEGSGGDPFAQLLADLEAQAHEPIPSSPFGSSFETEATYSDSAAHSGAAVPRGASYTDLNLELDGERLEELRRPPRKRPIDALPDEETDDRNVTEIVRLDRLK